MSFFDPWGVNYPDAVAPKHVKLARIEMRVALEAIAKVLLYSQNEDYRDDLRSLLRDARKISNALDKRWNS